MILAGLAGLAQAVDHELVVANFLSGLLYTVNFNDETLGLDLIANISVPVPSSWIAFSVSIYQKPRHSSL